MVNPGIEEIKRVAMDSADSKKQLQIFATGAIERIKENYERRKVNNESIENSDRKTRALYDMTQIKSDLVRINEVIEHAKAALTEMKKED